MTENATPVAPEFSFEIVLDDIGRGGKQFRLTANETERKKIAARLNTPSVHKLEGEMKVKLTKTAIRVEGALAAELTRECVASLEPVEERVAETFEIDFSRTPMSGDEEDDIDSPEFHEGDTLDLGELLVQQLSLAMEPFPRKEGAASLAEAYAPPEKVSPFAALKGAFGKSDDNQ